MSEIRTGIIGESPVRDESRRNANILAEHTRSAETAAECILREWLIAGPIAAETRDGTFFH